MQNPAETWDQKDRKGRIEIGAGGKSKSSYTREDYYSEVSGLIYGHWLRLFDCKYIAFPRHQSELQEPRESLRVHTRQLMHE